MSTQKNIHGSWSMTFKNRVLRSKTLGQTNSEAVVQYFEEVKSIVLSSPDGDSIPWVAINDLRDWEGMTPESGNESDRLVSWAFEHNCVLAVTVMSIKLQKYMVELSKESRKVTVVFDYDEGYQLCLDKLTKANSS